MFQSIKAIIFILLLFITAFVGSIIFGITFLPIALCSPSIFRRIFSCMIEVWEIQVAALMELFLGIKFSIEGELRPDEPCIFIMNHRTCFDWMYFWSLLARQSKIRNEKLVLKSPLKHIPGAGWAMQMAGFMFLDRSWDVDKPYLQTMLNSYFYSDFKPQILIFPEGTDMSPWAVEKSNLYAIKNDLPQYKYLLHPRTTGLGFMYEEMRKKWDMAPIYDIIISYSSKFPQNEKELIKGKIPKIVHFDIHRFDSSELPDKSEQIGIWCENLWKIKEKRLEEFYSKMNSSVKYNISERDFILNLRYILTLIFWLNCVVIFFWLLIHSLFLFYVITVSIVFCIVGSFRGFELLLAQYSIFKSKVRDE